MVFYWLFPNKLLAEPVVLAVEPNNPPVFCWLLVVVDPKRLELEVPVPAVLVVDPNILFVPVVVEPKRLLLDAAVF